MLQLDKHSLQEEKLQVLESILERFNEAGEKLEQRYAELARETESLREQLREKDIEVKRNEKLALLGETAAAIAHEVRNPLGAIKLFVSLLRRDLQGQSGPLELVQQIDASIESLDHVVSNILQFAKDKQLTFAPVNMHSLIREELTRLRAANRGTAQILSSLSGNPFVLANDSALRQILHNLAMNALQATRYSGDVVISCRDGENDALVIEVADSGPGVAEEIRGRIFEPFVTGRSEGTGLGLAIVRQLVREHDGTIDVWNDNGAHFRIIIPRQIVRGGPRG